MGLFTINTINTLPLVAELKGIRTALEQFVAVVKEPPALPDEPMDREASPELIDFADRITEVAVNSTAVADRLDTLTQ